MKKDTFSIPISIQKILQLKKQRTVVIVHKRTARWISLLNKFPKEIKKVRFYNQLYEDTITLTILSVEDTYQLRERVIKVRVKIPWTYEKTKTRTVLYHKQNIIQG